MITQKIYLYKYDWKVVVLYEVDHTDTSIVIGILRHICDDDKAYKLVYDNLNRKKLNQGFIYSNYNTRETLIGIGKASSNQELIDTIVHEANHLQSHIATAFNLNEKGEEVCYLIGGVVKTMFKVFSKLICAK